MTFTQYENAELLELSRIARLDIMIDQIEEMLVTLDIPRESYPWMWWEIQAEQNERLLTAWMERFDEYMKRSTTQPAITEGF
jgi:hypothetical protein